MKRLVKVKALLAPGDLEAAQADWNAALLALDRSVEAQLERRRRDLFDSKGPPAHPDRAEELKER